MTPYYHAILNGATLYINIPKDGHGTVYPLELGTAPTLPELLEVAYKKRIGTIWASYLNNALYGPIGDFDEWKVSPTYMDNRPGLPPFLKSLRAWKHGVPRRQAVKLLYPFYTTYSHSLNIESDPVGAMASIYYAEKALGVPLEGNAGITGRNIILASNSTRQRKDWIRGTDFDFMTLPDEIGFDMASKREISPDEAAGQKFLLVVDKASQYMATAAGLYMGVGAPTHVHGVRSFPVETKYPALYRIKVYDAIPSFLDPRYTDSEGMKEWYSNDILAYFNTLNVGYRVLEGYVWEEYHRVLDTFAELMFRSRVSLRTDFAQYPHSGGREIAEWLCKRVATVSIGMFANKQVYKYDPMWYRPDYRGRIVDASKAIMLQKILKIFRTTGQIPVYTDVDQVCYIVNDPDHRKALHGAFAKDGLGGWRVKYNALLTPDLTAHLNEAKTAGQAARVIRLLTEKREIPV